MALGGIDNLRHLGIVCLSMYMELCVCTYVVYCCLCNVLYVCDGLQVICTINRSVLSC